MNYMGSVSIRQSEGKGRGIFADRAIKSGELIIVDRAIVSVWDKPTENNSIEIHVSESKIQDRSHNHSMMACKDVA